ncbi:hypothetical protein MYX82_04715 [Acidobacteria bacterium AH-259-D05]|nr:hypothetical protein [Acidobacteria bacterium AH-259-D05]
MAGQKLAVVSLSLVLGMVGVMGAVGRGPQSESSKNQSVLSALTASWGPCSAEEEIRIASYLKRQTQSYFNILEQLDPESFKEQPFMDEKTAEVLELTLSDLKISMKEMIDTLGLMERLFEQRPADYAQSAPLLWLTIVKDISIEKENAKNLQKLDLVKSNWPGIVEISLPRLFSRILEPKLTELLRVPRR